MFGRFLDKLFRIDRLSDHPPAGSPEAAWHGQEHNKVISGLMSKKHAEEIRASDMKSKAIYDDMDNNIEKLRDFQTQLKKRRQ